MAWLFLSARRAIAPNTGMGNGDACRDIRPVHRAANVARPRGHLGDSHRGRHGNDTLRRDGAVAGMASAGEARRMAGRGKPRHRSGIGTRPTAVLIAPILLLPLVQVEGESLDARCENHRGSRASTLPLPGRSRAVQCGRFGNPMEFGQTFQLAALQYVGKLRQYGFDYIWDNIRIYFLNFVPWTTTFPYVGSQPGLVLNASHAKPEFCFGILGNVPIVFMALAALLASRRRDGLSFIALVVLWVAAVQIGLLMVFFGAVSRYEVEILTPLLGLAGVGLIAVEAGARGDTLSAEFGSRWPPSRSPSTGRRPWSTPTGRARRRAPVRRPQPD